MAREVLNTAGIVVFVEYNGAKKLVYWYERRGKGEFLAATPIDVSQILRARLFEQFDTIVMEPRATLRPVAGQIRNIRKVGGPR